MELLHIFSVKSTTVMSALASLYTHLLILTHTLSHTYINTHSPSHTRANTFTKKLEAFTTNDLVQLEIRNHYNKIPGKGNVLRCRVLDWLWHLEQLPRKPEESEAS